MNNHTIFVLCDSHTLVSKLYLQLFPCKRDGFVERNQLSDQVGMTDQTHGYS